MTGEHFVIGQRIESSRPLGRCYPQDYGRVGELLSGIDVQCSWEAPMDERLTILILGWSIGAVVATLFALNALALAG